MHDSMNIVHSIYTIYILFMHMYVSENPVYKFIVYNNKNMRVLKLS